VALAGELHLATEGLAGPRVPSDRPLVPGSLVHYRYGAFCPRRPASTDADTERRYDLLDDGGRLTHDFRLPFYRGPGGVADPFEAAGVHMPQLRDGPLAGRFLVHESLGRSWRGGVYRAIDLGLATGTALCAEDHLARCRPRSGRRRPVLGPPRSRPPRSSRFRPGPAKLLRPLRPRPGPVPDPRAHRWSLPCR
jgi:hypothetical protein